MVKKIVLWILCISWAIGIFCFSAQPADESNETSLGFTEQIVRFFADINIIDLPQDAVEASLVIDNICENINTLIRKIAHFSIYLILGVLVILLINCYKMGWKSVLAALLVCLLYAISDEIHQLFVPGRAGMVMDVGIDFLGSASGIGGLKALKRIFKR